MDSGFALGDCRGLFYPFADRIPWGQKIARTTLATLALSPSSNYKDIRE
jgi:hypothetical protein